MAAPIKYKYPLNLPDVPEDRIIRKDKNSKWGHLVCVWNQKTKNAQTGQIEIIAHKYDAVINCKTLKIYNDDKQFGKCGDEHLALNMKFPGLTIMTPYF